MAGFSNDTMYASNVNFSGAKTPSVTTDGQLLVGSTSAPNIRVGTLTSPDMSITIGYSSPDITLTAASTPLPPEVATQYTTQINGPAIPIANNLNVFGTSVRDNDVRGIFSNGSLDSILIALTNRISETIQTVGNTTQNLVVFDPAITIFSESGMLFNFEVVAYDSATPASLGYSIGGAARWNGTVSTIVGTPQADEYEDVVLSTADWDLVAVGNDVVLKVTGVTGLTFDWSVTGYYTSMGI